MADNNNIISFECYEKVNAIMQDDLKLKRLLSKPDRWVDKGDQTGKDFSKEVIEVAEAIQKAGIDISAAKPQQIMHFAAGMLALEQTALEPKPASAATKPKRKRRTKAEMEAARAAEAKTKSEAKAAKAKPASAAAPGKPRRKRRTKAEMEAARAAEAEADKVSKAAAGPVESLPKNKVGRPKRSATATVGGFPRGEIKYVRRFFPYIPGCVMMSNFFAIQTLLQPYLNDPEAKELYDNVGRDIDMLHARTVLPNYAQEEPEPS